MKKPGFTGPFRSLSLPVFFNVTKSFGLQNLHPPVRIRSPPLYSSAISSCAPRFGPKQTPRFDCAMLTFDDGYADNHLTLRAVDSRGNETTSGEQGVARSSATARARLIRRPNNRANARLSARIRSRL